MQLSQKNMTATLLYPGYDEEEELDLTTALSRKHLAVSTLPLSRCRVDRCIVASRIVVHSSHRYVKANTTHLPASYLCTALCRGGEPMQHTVTAERLCRGDAKRGRQAAPRRDSRGQGRQ